MNSLRQNERSSRFVVLCTLAITLFFGFSAYAQDTTKAAGGVAIDGQALFKVKCASCHGVGDKKLIGPGLGGVLSRIPSGTWKYEWVHNSSAMIAKGDPYAVKIFKEFNNSIMTAFPELSNDEIDAILNWVDAYVPPKPVVAAGGETVGEEDIYKEPSTFMWMLILTFLIVMIAILRYTKINLRNAVNEKEGLPEEPTLPFLEASRVWMNNNKKLVALIGVFLFCVLTVKGWYLLKGIGVYAEEVKPNKWEGYHPVQPINFSHKIHAGDNGIQCQYCHNTVEKSKIASIPSANVCMNCHRVISETTTPGSKEEIAKIYKAIGWDGSKYTGEEHPIQWVKVHNLPNHVFFSHQQHVVVGKVACDMCHGDVKTMTTVEQQRPLTMGWCINCHRETTVQMEGNGYYATLHEKMKEKYKGQPITVSMIGGIECARCHY
ncbi:MAG TPA: cytochrome c3 family protein [Bacteroidia bacterium]|nr:cytochrome c3 family protein [Bacteroidia bacterium]